MKNAWMGMAVAVAVVGTADAGSTKHKSTTTTQTETTTTTQGTGGSGMGTSTGSSMSGAQMGSSSMSGSQMGSSGMVNTPNPAIPTGIDQMSQQFAQAWNRHDPAAMAQFYAADATLVNPFGRSAKGRAEIQKLFQYEQSAMMGNSRMEQTVTSVRPLGTEYAFVDSNVTISGIHSPDGTPMPTQRFVNSSLVVQRNGKWQFLDSRPHLLMPEGGAPGVGGAGAGAGVSTGTSIPQTPSTSHMNQTQMRDHATNPADNSGNLPSRPNPQQY